MNLAGKRLLILGGSRISCEIVKHAKNMGIITGVTEYYPIEKKPAKQMADEAYFVSTSDVDAIVKLVKENKFDGVFTGFTDSVLPYYAEICKRLEFPCYGTKEQFELFIDKQKYKAKLREYDIPTIPEFTVDLNDFESSTEMIEYPVLVKPGDSSGSRGITVCHNKEELKTAIDFAGEYSQAHSILVEKFIEAPEATVFWLFVDGKYYMNLLGNRHIKHNQEGVLPLPVGYTYPASIQPKYLNEVAPKMKKMFTDLGIQNGMMFLQCKIVEGTCVVYDIGYRLTGSLEYINLKGMCGYDPMDMMIRHALTGESGEPNIEEKVDPTFNKKYSFNVSILAKPGKIEKIEGLDDVIKHPNVFDAVVAHPPGDEITEKMKGLLAQITVRILGGADSIEEMKHAMLEVQNMISVISDKGEEMKLSGMEESDFINTVLEY